MKHNRSKQNKTPQPAPSQGHTRRGRGRWWVVMVLVGVGMVGVLAMTLSGPATPSATPPSVVDASRLVGRWQRPDGGYVIDIRGAQAGGQLDAAYFNPRPIHVSRAEWRKESDGLRVFVELRDTNYPGATYKLRYSPEKDQLAGEYYQPLVQQTFDVNFIHELKR